MSKKKIRRPQQYKKPPERTMKEWWQGMKPGQRKTLIGVCSAVIAVIVLALVFYYGIYDDGSLKIRDNAAVGAQDSWLIGSRSSGKNSVYYHLADVTAPEGYTAGSDPATAPQKGFSFDKDGISVNILGVSRSVSDIVDSVYTYIGAMVGENGTVSEITDCETPQGAGKYYSYSISNTDENSVTTWSKSLALYVPDNYSDSCILVSASQRADTLEALPEDSILLAEAMKAAEGITLVK